MSSTLEQDLQRRLYDLLAIAAPDPHQSFRQFFTYGVVGANVLVFLGWHQAEQQQQQQKFRPGSQRRQTKWNIPYIMNKIPGGESTEKVMQDHFLLTEHNVRRGRWWTVLTSTFSHNQVYHLATNMISFVTCANLALRPDVGIDPLSTVILALGSAAAGSGAELLQWHRQREQRKKDRSDRGVLLVPRALGASAMVNGMSVALTLLRPMLPINVSLIPKPVPMWLATLAYAAWDFFNMDNEQSTGISHAGHLGGAAFGALFYLVRLRHLDVSRAVGGWSW